MSNIGYINKNRIVEEDELALIENDTLKDYISEIFSLDNGDSIEFDPQSPDAGVFEWEEINDERSRIDPYSIIITKISDDKFNIKYIRVTEKGELYNTERGYEYEGDGEYSEYIDYDVDFENSEIIDEDEVNVIFTREQLIKAIANDFEGWI